MQCHAKLPEDKKLTACMLSADSGYWHILLDGGCLSEHPCWQQDKPFVQHGHGVTNIITGRCGAAAKYIWLYISVNMTCLYELCVCRLCVPCGTDAMPVMNARLGHMPVMNLRMGHGTSMHIQRRTGSQGQLLGCKVLYTNTKSGTPESYEATISHDSGKSSAAQLPSLRVQDAYLYASKLCLKRLRPAP